MNNGRLTTRGLTLVELLVVMAIATVLVGVLVPALIQSRNRARASACLSNLRQIGGAVLLYSHDCGDRLPMLQGTSFAGSRPVAGWPDGTSATMARLLLEKRTSGGRVFGCLNDSGAPEYGFAVRQGSVYSRAGSSYMPWSTARGGRYGIAANGAFVSSLARPSAHVLFRDYGADWHGCRTSSGMAVRSLAQANAVFADGHAKSIPVYAFVTDGGSYACTAVTVPGDGAIVALAGESYGGRVELTGTYANTTNGDGRRTVRLQLSGSAANGGSMHEIDRVFTLGEDSDVESALRQLVYWVDNLLGA